MAEGILLQPTHAQYRAGETVTFTLPGVDEVNCVLDPGDGRQGVEYWPPVRALVYDQPGRYRVRLVDGDYEIAAADVEITGPLNLSVSEPYPVVGRDDWAQIEQSTGLGGTDNTLGMLADPLDQNAVYYYWAYGIDRSGIVRSRGTVQNPLVGNEVRHAFVHGNQYTAPHYLDAGPVHYDPTSDLLLMLALSGRSAGRGVVYGTVELLWSRDLGLSWQSAGPVVTQPVSFEQVAADPDAYGPYPNMGTSAFYLASGDDEGNDYLLCFFSQCHGPLLGLAGNMAQNWNPCGVARARVRELAAAIEGGRPVSDLWEKRLDGQWNSPCIGGCADVVTRAGGAFANQVTWCEPLQKYLMIAQSINSRGQGVFHLQWSYDLLNWSEPQPLWADMEEYWFATTPSFLAPFGHVGREFAVWYPVWEYRGENDWGRTELQGITVRLW